MDNIQGQAGTPPQTASSDDFVNNPSYTPQQGAPSASSTSTGGGDFVSNPAFTGSTGTPNEMNSTSLANEIESGTPNPNRNPLSRAAIRGVSALEGVGEEAFNTLHGITTANDFSKHPILAATNLPLAEVNLALQSLPGGKEAMQKVEDRLNELAGNNTTIQGTPQKIGRWAETLGELISGEGATKELSLGDKMLESGKIAKLLESHPKVLTALRSGMSLQKATAAMTEEERALVAAHPFVARLVSAGYDALRTGALQGAQTEAKTNDTKQAAKDALEMAGTTGALGATLGTIGGVAAKTGKVAETAQALNEAAKNAPTPEGVRSQVEGFVHEALNPERAKLDAAQRDVAGFAAGAGSKESLTDAAQKYAQEAEKSYHGAYQQGIAGIKGDLAGETIPYENSPLHQAAQALVSQGEAEAKPLDKGFKKNRPGSPALNQRLDFLANPQAAEEAEAEAPQASGLVDAQGNPIPASTPAAEPPPPIDLDINELLARRKELGEQLRNTGWATDEQRQDRTIYKRLMQGVDDSIDQLATQASENVENPNAANILPRYRAINNAYRQSSRIFENKDVQSILEGRQNDVMHKLITGNTSLDDINAVKQAFGDQLYHRFATDALQRFAADSIDEQGHIDYNGLLKKWNRIKPDVRDAAFGKFSSDTFSNVLNGAVGADDKLRSANQTLANFMDGNTASVLKNPERLNELESVIGPNAMTEVGKSIVQNQLREASTVNPKTGAVSFDPNRFIKWLSDTQKNSPEALNRLFRSTPETQAAFDKLVKNVSDVRTQKALNKLGITMAGAGTVAPLIPAAIAHPVISILSMLVGGAAHEAGAGNAFKQVIDRLADSPATWKALTGFSKGTAAVEAAAKKAPELKTTTSKAIYSAAKNALAGGGAQ